MEMMRLKALGFWQIHRIEIVSFLSRSRIFFPQSRDIYIYIGYIERVLGVVDVIDNFEPADSNCSIVRTLYGEVCFSLLFCFRIDIILSRSCN